jgi:Tol biopolymer transport system component
MRAIMPPGAGSRLGTYEILGTLGAGGMGVVYRARDVKLKRDVALKILPDTFAGDPERLERFQREAQAIAALNHPNVVTIYSVEEVDGVHFLTMELIDGKPLSDLIPAGGLPVEGLLKIALPLTDAISAAHQRSIIHRDLKPANVMVGPGTRVKVLDFGLAKLKLESAEGVEAGLTTTANVSAEQRVMGTPAYMSPEQAEGRSVDARADIFSLGVMLYEMAAGHRPFTGDSSLAILSSILKDAPAPLKQVKPDLPPDLDRIVRRCLAKAPAGRYQTALDVHNELEDLGKQALAASGPATEALATPPSRRRYAPALAAGLAIVAATAAYVVWRSARDATPAAPVRAMFRQLTSTPGGELFPRLSPDGRWVVYSGEGAGNRDIFLQSVSGQTPINLTADSPVDDTQPAFSPDGERIAFRSSRDGGGIFVMGRTGEALRRITRAGFNPAWSPDGTELAYTTVPTEFRPQNADQRGQLMVVPVNGGEPRTLVPGGMLPGWSPRGLRIAFSGGLNEKAGGAHLATVARAGGEAVPVTRDGFLNWNPVWAPDGRHLYFVSNRGGSTNIWRIALDEGSGVPAGEPEPITTPATFATHLSLSGDGSQLVYTSVLETQNIERLRLDPATGAVLGEPDAVTTGSRFWANPDPSPDGESVVIYSQVGPEGDLYITKADGSGGLRQLTDDAAIDRVPRWSPDGKWIAMFSDRGGALNVWVIGPDGSDFRRVTNTRAGVAAWSPDGKRLAVARNSREGTPAAIIDPSQGLDYAVEDLPMPALSGLRFVPNSWSPDGTRIAGQNGYTTPGIYQYSPAARRYEQLADFGEWPVWLPDGRRLLFVSRGREFHVLDTQTKAATMVYSSLRDTLGPPRLTRDGRAAFYSRRVTEADIWLATLR